MLITQYLKILFGVGSYVHGDEIGLLKNQITKMYNLNSEASNGLFLMENGRGAFLLFLKSLNLPEGSEVILPAYTCSVMAAAVITAGLKPIYADVGYDLNVDAHSIAKVLTSNCKVVVVQHSYGKEAKIDDIKKLLEDKGVLIVEDCAQCIGFRSDLDGKIIGLSGDATIFSFGYDKVLPTRVGGVLLVNNNSLIDLVDEQFKLIRFTSYVDTFRWLINPMLWRVIRILKFINPLVLGRVLAKLKLINLATSEMENFGKLHKKSPTKMSNGIAKVTLSFLKQIEENITMRERITSKLQSSIKDLEGRGKLLFETAYLNGRVYQKFPIFLKDENEMLYVNKKLRDLGYYVYPPAYIHRREDTFSALRYNKELLGSLGHCQRVLLLPTDFLPNDGEKAIVTEINELVSQYQEESASKVE